MRAEEKKEKKGRKGKRERKEKKKRDLVAEETSMRGIGALGIRGLFFVCEGMEGMYILSTIFLLHQNEENEDYV